jgi:uncharacterized protein YlxW (UPF0749 family)
MSGGAGPARETPLTARPLDASMTLLREVMERPLDPGYAAAAAAPRRRTRRRTVITLVLAIVAGAAFSIAVGSIRQPSHQATEVNRELRKRIEEQTALIEKREAANAALSATIAMARQNALGASDADLASQVAKLGLNTGESPTAGPGLRFTVNDAPGRAQTVGGDPRADRGYDLGIVLDADLQVIVNGLWAAGAEAIAINGERLTSLSAIRSAGEAILVDFRPLVPPYVIDAVGDSSRMQTAFATGTAGPYVQSMRDNGGIRIDIAAADKLALPGAGQLILRQARPATATPNRLQGENK